MNEKRALIGRKEIMNYTGRSWPVIHEWIKERRFPARKIDGVWESYTFLVDDWKVQIITAENSCKI